MSLLAATAYDPAVAATNSTASLLPMTAIDTTNLRLTFTAPSNGTVWVRLRGVLQGGTTFAQILLGVLDGATIRGRVAPYVSRNTALATYQAPAEAGFLVTGLTPGTSYTWDAAYGVEVVVASTAIKYGGPNDTTTNNAFGSFIFEVWETPSLLAGTLYDPASAVTNKLTSSNLAITAFDTTNLRLTFTAPNNGKVLIHMRCVASQQTGLPGTLFAVLDGATVRGRVRPRQSLNDSAFGTTNQQMHESFIVVTGLVSGTSYTWDASYGVDLVGAASSSFQYGGPDDSTTNNAWGGFGFSVWQTNALPFGIGSVI